jgi:hypothetical protein
MYSSGPGVHFVTECAIQDTDIQSATPSTMSSTTRPIGKSRSSATSAALSRSRSKNLSGARSLAAPRTQVRPRTPVSRNRHPSTLAAVEFDHVSCAAVPGNDRAGALRRHSQWVVKQVRVPVSGSWLAVSQQGTNHRQAQPGAREDAGVRVPQIVHADTSEPRRRADRSPVALNLNQVTPAVGRTPSTSPGRKEERGGFPIRPSCALVGHRLHLRQELPHRCR